MTAVPPRDSGPAAATLPDRYAPNTHHWQVGDLVVHFADYKATYMLMVVVGFTRDGLVKTKYANPSERMHYQTRRKIWVNELAYLLDPAKFNIANIAAAPGADEAVGE